MSLKFIALSGTTGVTENLYIYEYGDSMLIVDCGVGFPELEMYGVDLVIPDFSYIKKNARKLKGILVSQGHEDHQGALPFLLKDVKAPVYAPKLTAAFIKDKLEEYGIDKVTFRVYDPDRDTIDIDPFRIIPFRVTHSIPDTVGFAIDTPEGRTFHVAEHKFDPTPVDGKPFDIHKAADLASSGVLFLTSDCLGSNKKGKTESEAEIEENLYEVMKDTRGAIFFTTISSNIGRIQQAINVAGKLQRQVVFIGRSIKRKAEIAHNLGYLHHDRHTVLSLKKANEVPRDKLMYIIAGCYGQVGSSLFRVATSEHDKISAEAGDKVVFSADPGPPYSKESMDFVIDNLIDMGVDVHYYDLEENLYVSGHGSQEDITRLFEIVKPKYFIPIGGTIRFMHSYKKLAVSFGADESRVFQLKPGESVIFENGLARRGEKIAVKNVLVDGLGIGDVGRVVLEDRRALAEHGVATVIIKLHAASGQVQIEPEIISRGFVFEKQGKKFLQDSARLLKAHLNKHKKLDRRKIRFLTVDFLAELFLKETGRRPMILPVVVEV